MYTPAQIIESDTRLRRCIRTHHEAQWRADSAERSVYYAAGQLLSPVWGGRGRFWTRNGNPVTFDEVVDLVRQIAEGLVDPGGRRDAARSAEEALARLSVAQENLAMAAHALSGTEREWEANGRWDRYFAVSGGRVHATRDCRSLRADTRALPIPELSGKPLSVAVADFGSCLCSSCFPTTPKEWTGNKYLTPKMRKINDTRAQRQAEREAKQILDPATGDPLIGYSRHHRIRTERTAHNMVIEALTDLRRYGVEHPDAEKWIDYADRAIPAIAAKRGLSDLDALRREYDDKAYIKYARELRKQST